MAQFDTEWDVNKYKYHYELPHHWELKKKFMLFHKKRFPEDRLICLSQIFCNVHFLGCRYGEEIMELIEELTQDITSRNEKFDSKSFALASDAVEAKVKAFTGQNKSSGVGTVRQTVGPIAFIKASEPDKRGGTSSQDVVDLTDSPPGQKRPPDNSYNGNQSKYVRYYNEGYYKNQRQNYEQQNFEQPNHQSNQHNQYRVQFNQQETPLNPQQQQQQFHGFQRQNQQDRQDNRLHSFEGKRAAAMVKEVVESGPFGKVVVFKSSFRDDGVISIIERAASAAHMTTSFDINQGNGQFSCKFCLDGMYVADGVGKSQRLAKEAACQLALERLKETSYTIEVKATYIGGDKSIERDMEGNEGKKMGLDVPLAESNIGNKMMKMMGWTGGGLGKEEQGIEEPIKPYDQNIRRGGLGITNFSDFRRKITRIIEDYAHSSDKNDLVFSSDFTKDERKTIHNLVSRYNLKSRSYGKTTKTLVVFRKISPLEIVEELLICGGETQKYKLIPPNPKMK